MHKIEFNLEHYLHKLERILEKETKHKKFGIVLFNLPEKNYYSLITYDRVRDMRIDLVNVRCEDDTRTKVEDMVKKLNNGGYDIQFSYERLEDE